MPSDLDNVGTRLTQLPDIGSPTQTQKVLTVDQSTGEVGLVMFEDIPFDDDLAAIALLTGTGVLERTGPNVWALNTDLYTIGGLTPSNDDVLQRKTGAWINRSIAQLLADLAVPGTTFQPLDDDLTAIAALTTASFGRSLLTLSSALLTGSGFTMNTARILGRTTASAGAIEEISIGTGLMLSGGTLQANALVSSVAMSVPAWLSVSGSPITSSGTLAVTLRDKLAGVGPAGLGLSRSSATAIGIAAGWILDATAVDVLYLASAYTKTTSSWAVGTGNGGLDTGSITTSTWYSVWLIKRVDTGVVDVLFSTSATSPTMPANYTLKRRIGWVKTNGSSQFIDFVQQGYQFHWLAKVADVNTTTPGTTRNTVSPTLPPSTIGIISWSLGTNGAGTYYLDIGPTGVTDSAASSTNFIGQSGANASAPYNGAGKIEVPIDSSGQYYYRCSASGVPIILLSLGWIDNLVI